MAGPRIRRARLVLVTMAVLALASCAPVAVPSSSPDAIATIVAATQNAAPTFTALLPPTRTPTPTRTPLPTPILGTPVSPVLLGMSNGATFAVVDGQIQPRESQSYAVRGIQGQPMILELESTSGDAQLSMMSKGGTFFLRPGVAQDWRGVLPEAGMYYFGVYGGAAPTDFRLAVTLISRVLFKEGEDSATVVGRTPDGTISALSVFGLKGAKLTLTLSGTGSQAAMSIEGFQDRKSYLDISADKRSFKLVAPITQDYLIRIVPDAGATTNYVFDVGIQ